MNVFEKVSFLCHVVSYSGFCMSNGFGLEYFRKKPTSLAFPLWDQRHHCILVWKGFYHGCQKCCFPINCVVALQWLTDHAVSPAWLHFNLMLVLNLKSTLSPFWIKISAKIVLCSAESQWTTYIVWGVTIVRSSPLWVHEIHFYLYHTKVFNCDNLLSSFYTINSMEKK